MPGPRSGIVRKFWVVECGRRWIGRSRRGQFCRRGRDRFDFDGTQSHFRPCWRVNRGLRKCPLRGQILTTGLTDLQRRLGELVADYVRPRPRLLLPNLHPTFINPAFAPNMQICVEIQNNGDAPTAHRCWVLLELTVRSRAIQPQTWSLLGICDPLPAHQRTTVYFPLIQGVPEEAVATACVTVDVPTPQNPGGLIWESNEDDNYLCASWTTSLAEPREIPNPPEHSINEVPPEDPDWGKRF